MTNSQRILWGEKSYAITQYAKGLCKGKEGKKKMLTVYTDLMLLRFRRLNRCRGA